MKQIHEAVQALETDIGFLEETEKKQKKLPGRFPRANMDTANILK